MVTVSVVCKVGVKVRVCDVVVKVRVCGVVVRVPVEVSVNVMVVMLVVVVLLVVVVVTLDNRIPTGKSVVQQRPKMSQTMRRPTNFTSHSPCCKKGNSIGLGNRATPCSKNDGTSGLRNCVSPSDLV